MSKGTVNQNPAIRSLPKASTGIEGLDEITGGGLPRGRPTLVCGSAGCGKTLLAMEFLVHGATQFGEPGVSMAFEETAEELAQNVRSLGFDLEELAARNQLLVDYVRVERSEIEETGEYDLEGLFIRLGPAIDTVGAKRVVLPVPEPLQLFLLGFRLPALGGHLSLQGPALALQLALAAVDLLLPAQRGGQHRPGAGRPRSSAAGPERDGPQPQGRPAGQDQEESFASN
jgi:KaiC protein